MSILSLFLAMSPAHAEAFSYLDLPYTATFEYTWTSPSVPTASTDFTFDTATQSTSTFLCRDTESCMSNGRFFTGNGGTGAFTVRVNSSYPADCTAIGPVMDPGAPGGNTFQWHDCDITETTTLLYDDTGAIYLGTAYWGNLNALLRFNPAGQVTQVRFKTYTYDPDPFAGLMFGPGTGTFVEI